MTLYNSRLTYGFITVLEWAAGFPQTVDPQALPQAWVDAYNAATKTVTLFNPWGINNGTNKPGLIQLNLSQLSGSFNFWATA